MKFTKFSSDMVAELLTHLADYEKFASLKGINNVTKIDIQTMLGELAEQVRATSDRQPIVRKSQLSNKDLAQKTSHAISKLTPKEEELLLKSFRISE